MKGIYERTAMRAIVMRVIAGLGIADVLVSWLEENRTTAP